MVDPVERFTAAQCLEHEWVRRAGEASAKKLHRHAQSRAEREGEGEREKWTVSE